MTDSSGEWGLSQLVTGAASDHLGRKWMIAAAMLVQAMGIGLFVVGTGYAAWMLAAVLLGFGTALVYPTLIAAVSADAHPGWRASAVGGTGCSVTLAMPLAGCSPGS